MDNAKLLKLAAFLKRVPKRKFKMDWWAYSRRPMADKPVCATKACALGWATAIPEFNRAGLELRAYVGNDSAMVCFGDETGFEAGSKFFDLTEDQAGYLFGRGSDDPKKKAAEIERLVRNGGALPVVYL